MEEKKGSVGKIIGTIFLVIILTIVLFTGYVFYRMYTTKVQGDVMSEIISKEAMDMDERFTVSEDGKLIVKLDESDIYYFLDKAYGESYIEQVINDLGRKTGIKVSAYHFAIENDQPYISVEAKYNGIKLAVTLQMDASLEDNAIKFTVSKIKIAGMSFGSGLFKDLQNLSVKIKADTWFLKKIDKLEIKDDKICLYGDLNEELLKAVDPKQGYDINFSYYIGDKREVLDAGMALSSDPKKAQEIFLNGIKELGFRKVMDDYFSVAFAGSSNTLMKNNILRERFLKEYDGTDFIAKYRPSSDQADSGRKNMGILTDQVYRQFNLGNIKIKDSHFYLGDEPFKYEDFLFEGWSDVYKTLLRPGSFRLVLIDDPDSFKGDVGALVNHIDSIDSIAEEVNVTRQYPLGFICETSGGSKIIGYNVKIDGPIGFASKIFELSDEEFKALSDMTKVHVYRKGS